MTRTRRLTAVAAGILAAALMTACTAGTHSNSDTASSGGSGIASGTGGSALTVMTPAAKSDLDKVTWNVFEGEPQTIDPFHSADYSPDMINANLCENLLAETPDFQIKPNLAQSFSNPDPLHWVYNLRADVTFWDGAPMTAEDVAWSMNHNLTDKTSLYNYIYANVKSIAVTGPHQVTVTLNKPDYLFNDDLASFAGVVVEKKFFEAHAKDFGSPSVGVMCTGPFQFSKWTQGQSITMTRYPNYWNKSLTPKVHTLVFTFVTDPSAITAGLLSGQIDGTYIIPQSGYGQLKNSTVGKLYVGPAGLEATLVYTNPHGAMSNLTLRKALQMAIDWNGMAQSIYNGAATPLKIQIPPQTYGFAHSDLQKLADSLPAPQSAQYAAAKKLVDQVPADIRSKPISMVVPNFAEMQQFGIAVKDAAGRIGLNFQLKVVPVDTYVNYLYDAKTRGNTDILFTQYWSGPNPLDWVRDTAVSGGSFNQYGYNAVDSLFAKAVGTADPTQRATIVTQLETQLSSQLLPMAPGLGLDNTLWMNNRITGAPASQVWWTSPWAVYLGGTA